MPGASNKLAGMEATPWSEAIVPPTRRTPPRKHFGETLRASTVTGGQEKNTN